MDRTHHWVFASNIANRCRCEERLWTSSCKIGCRRPATSSPERCALGLRGRHAWRLRRNSAMRVRRTQVRARGRERSRWRSTGCSRDAWTCHRRGLCRRAHNLSPSHTTCRRRARARVAAVSPRGPETWQLARLVRMTHLHCEGSRTTHVRRRLRAASARRTTSAMQRTKSRRQAQRTESGSRSAIGQPTPLPPKRHGCARSARPRSSL